MSLAMSASVALLSDCGGAELMPVTGCPGTAQVGSPSTLLHVPMMLSFGGVIARLDSDLLEQPVDLR